MSEPPLKKNKPNSERIEIDSTSESFQQPHQEINSPQSNVILTQSPQQSNSLSEEFFDLNTQEFHRWSPEEFCSFLVCPKPHGLGWSFKLAQKMYHSLIPGDYSESIESKAKRFEAGANLKQSMVSQIQLFKSVRVKNISFLYRIELQEIVVSEDCSILKDETTIISNNMVEMRKVVKKYVSLILEGTPKKGLEFIQVIGNARTGKTTMAGTTLPFFIQQEFLKFSKFEKRNFRKFYFDCQLIKPSSLIESSERRGVAELFLRFFSLEDTHTFVIFDQVQLLSDEEMIILKIMITSLRNSEKITSIITGSSQAILMKKMTKAGTNGVSFKECAINLCLDSVNPQYAIDDTKKCYLTHFPMYQEVIPKLCTIENEMAIKNAFGFVHPAHLTQLLYLILSEEISFEDALFDLKNCLAMKNNNNFHANEKWKFYGSIAE